MFVNKKNIKCFGYSLRTDTLTERRLRRWTLSLEELLSDPRGFQEFETYLRKEYSYENILFWKAVQDLKRGSYACIPQRVTEIHRFVPFRCSLFTYYVLINRVSIKYVEKSYRKYTRIFLRMSHCIRCFVQISGNVFPLCIKKNILRFCVNAQTVNIYHRVHHVKLIWTRLQWKLLWRP